MVLFLSAALWLFTQGQDQQYPAPGSTLRIGIDPSTPPFAYYADDAIVGFEIDVAEAIAELLEVQIAWVALGFDGLYDALLADRADLIIASISPNPLRLDDVHYSIPYYDAGLILISSAESTIDSFAAMPGRRLAFAYGTAAHTEARRWLRLIAPFALLPYERPQFALDAVRGGQADAALVSAIDAQLYRRRHPTWVVQEVMITHQHYVVMTDARRAALARSIDSALASLEADGTLAALRQRWLY